MSEFEAAVLIGPEVVDYPKIHLGHTDFIVGRGKSSSFVISNLMISKTHCIFQKKDGVWTVRDKSTFGTYVNSVRLEKDKPCLLTDGDTIAFDNSSHFKYVFCIKDVSKISSKKIRLDENVGVQDSKQEYEKRHLEENRGLQAGNTEQEKILQEKLELEKQCEERRIAEGKLLQEKRFLEEKLKEMENLLAKKDKYHEMLNKQLQEKEEQRLRDLKQKDAEAKIMLKELVEEVTEKELVIKIQLAREIQSLQEEKLKIENDIRGALSRKEEESAEHLKQLQEELQKVKRDLSNTEGKMQYLVKELEKTTEAKEIASESCLRAKQDVLTNFGELVETELQCSICNELFVSATTLNCTHTFCQYCIVQWKKKKASCPICRKRITSQNKSIVLDNFIDRMVENLSVDLKNRRQEIVEERQIQELLGPKPKGGPSRELRRRGRNAIPASSPEDHSPDASVIYIHGSSSSNTESDTSSSYESE